MIDDVRARGVRMLLEQNGRLEYLEGGGVDDKIDDHVVHRERLGIGIVVEASRQHVAHPAPDEHRGVVASVGPHVVVAGVQTWQVGLGEQVGCLGGARHRPATSRSAPRASRSVMAASARARNASENTRRPSDMFAGNVTTWQLAGTQ
ncbi:unannotated protein [freshwater metagenome]|uniref:Unannotated protein n=1 Tax=freshwater metagenome TaxID=449393 RepID=A0A6J6VYP6_9ZZZZ